MPLNNKMKRKRKKNDEKKLCVEIKETDWKGILVSIILYPFALIFNLCVLFFFIIISLIPVINNILAINIIQFIGDDHVKFHDLFTSNKIYYVRKCG